MANHDPACRCWDCWGSLGKIPVVSIKGVMEKTTQRLRAALDDPGAQTLGVYLTAETVSRLLNVADAAEAVQAAKLSHRSGWDTGMIFDEYDREVEQQRRGHWSIDDHAVERLDDAIGALRRLDAGGAGR